MAQWKQYHSKWSNKAGRQKLYEKMNGRCAYCGIRLDRADRWCPEHMMPQSRGGSDEFDNVVPACHRCNTIKGNHTPEEMREILLPRLYENNRVVLDQLQGYVGMVDHEAAFKVWEHIIEVFKGLNALKVCFYMDRKDVVPPQKEDWDVYTGDDRDMGTQHIEGNATPVDAGAG